MRDRVVCGVALWGPADIPWQQGSVRMLLPWPPSGRALAGVGAGRGRREVREHLVFKELLAWRAGSFHAGRGGRDECGLSP